MVGVNVDDGLDVLVQGGLVVTSRGVVRADIGVVGGSVRNIGPAISPPQGAKVIDATGKLVLPGAVDVHVHPIYLDDLHVTSVTAAHGGVTTVIHFAYAKPGERVVSTLDRFRDNGKVQSILDFGLHVGLFDVARQIEEVPAAIESGSAGIKVFLTYAKLKWMTDDYWLTALTDTVAQSRGMVMVHAENGLATDYLEDKHVRAGRSALDTFTATRPDLLEAEAVNRAMTIAHITSCALYIVHNSAAACLEPLHRARERGWRVYGETCPQYLVLSDKTTQRLGPLAKIGPPLRTREDNEALWRALADGTLDAIGSDHAPKLKRPEDDFFEAAFGSPQIETMLPVVYHWGVNGGRIPLPRLVEVMCETPAKLFGLYPRKGTLQVGSDADLVIIDPAQTRTLSAETQHSKAGYTLYEGLEVTGMPILTMQRGEVVVDHGELIARAGRAQFLPTTTAHLYA